MYCVSSTWLETAILLQLYQEAVEEKDDGIRSSSTDLPGS